MSIELDEKKIHVSELELGMFVSKLDIPWEETDFMMQGFLITTQHDIDAITEYCQHVYIELKKSVIKERPKKLEENEKRKTKRGLFARNRQYSKATDAKSSQRYEKPDTPKVTYINKLPAEQEFPKATKTFKLAKLTAKSIMEGFRIGRALDLNQCREVVDDVVDSILRNSNALVWLTKIKNKDEYTAEHCMNVCILSVAFARHLGLSREEIFTIGLCGLLHDVGKAKIPLEILNKPGRFTDEELEIMKQHTTFGRDLLMSMSGVDTAAVDVAFSHHERIDENGYPRQLRSHQIPYYSKIISITDTYDAITSNRVYDNARSSMDALDIIYKNKGRQFDEELALEFIKCIGVYPPGSIVELNSGEVAIVIATNDENKLKPRVLLVLDENKQPTKEKVIDLKSGYKNSQGKPYSISFEMPNGKYGVNIQDYVERGLNLKK